MRHHQVTPEPVLDNAVKAFWSLEQDALTYNRDAILPDSCVELIFNCGAPIVWDNDAGETLALPSVFIGRLQTRPLHLRALGTSRLMAVRLHPWAIRSFIDIPAVRNDVPYTPLTGHWERFGRTLNVTLNQHGYDEAFAQLQQFIIDMYYPPAEVSRMAAAGDLLYNTNGQMRLSEVAYECSLSLSQLERMCRQFTGVSPKMLARLIRFEGVRTALFMNPTVRPITLACDFGYSDQAHFTHDFKMLADCTPGEFAATVEARLLRRQYADFLQDS